MKDLLHQSIEKAQHNLNTTVKLLDTADSDINISVTKNIAKRATLMVAIETLKETSRVLKDELWKLEREEAKNDSN